MAKRQMRLTVTFRVEYEGDDKEMLLESDTMIAEETAALVIPQMEDKFVVLPKVLEGVTSSVIAKHNGLIREFYDRKNAREKEEAEKKRMLFPEFSNGHAKYS